MHVVPFFCLLYEIGEDLGVLLYHASYYLIILKSLNFIQLSISIIQFTNHFSTSFYYQPILVPFFQCNTRLNIPALARPVPSTTVVTPIASHLTTVFLHSRIRFVFLATASLCEFTHSVCTTVAPGLSHFKGQVPASRQHSVVWRNQI